MDFSVPFTGTISVSPPLNQREIDFLRAFSRTRHMRWPEGPYTTSEDWPQLGPSNENQPHEGQPGLWCNWEPTDDGAGLQWNGDTNFDDADEWLRYVVDHFLRPDAVAQQLAAARQSAGRRET
jgi:hypothetical protein